MRAVSVELHEVEFDVEDLAVVAVLSINRLRRCRVDAVLGVADSEGFIVGRQSICDGRRWRGEVPKVKPQAAKPVEFLAGVDRRTASGPNGNSGSMGEESKTVVVDELVSLGLLPSIELLQRQLTHHAVISGTLRHQHDGIMVLSTLSLVASLFHLVAAEESKNLERKKMLG